MKRFGVFFFFIAAVVLLCLGTMLVRSPQVRAQNENNQGNQGNDDESKIKQGFAIAPVKLNLEGKNRALVGLGSYIVNAQADCNGCHTLSPAVAYTPPGNPYGLPYPERSLPAGIGFGRPILAHVPRPHERQLLEYGSLEGGDTLDDFLEQYPGVTWQQAIAALEEAKALVLARFRK